MTEMENAVRDRDLWDEERRSLEEDLEFRTNMIEQLERRVHELETLAAGHNGSEHAILAKDEEIRRLQDDAERQRAAWERRVAELAQEKEEEVRRIQGEMRNLEVVTEQLDAGRDTLRSLVRSQKVPTSPSDNSLPSLATSLGAHIAKLDTRLKESERERTEVDILRRKYEEDVRNGLEIRERLGREVEEARREREDSRKDVRLLENRLKVSMRQRLTS
jgi:chromosome segregation ATPase